jgi:signal transduction histidine kinase
MREPGPLALSGGDTTRWRIAAAASALLCLAYLAVPLERVGLRTLLSAGGDLAAALWILAAVRRYRPRIPVAWLLFAAALATWAVADVVWGLYQSADKRPILSWADPLYLLAYPLFAGGLVVATHAQAPGFDWRAVVDPAILAVTAAFAAWVFIVNPALGDASVDGAEKLMVVVYPVADVLLVAVAARFALGTRWHEAASLRLLVAGLGLVLLGDVWYALAPEESLNELRFADAALLAGVLTIGLAGRHPSMPALTAYQPQKPRDRFVGRLAVVLVTSLVVPVIVWIEHRRGESLPLVAAAITATLLAALLVVRYAFSAAEARRAATREKTLRRYALELLGAGEAGDLYRVAGKAAVALAGDPAARIVGVEDAPPASPRNVAVPVEVAGETQALIVATGNALDIDDRRNALIAVAAQLSIALERQRLLAQEQETARTLNEQIERLRELDRMKDQFVSSVSHELRSPLTSIVGYMELLLDGEAGELVADQRRFLEIIGRNCTRLTKLVDDILFVARVDAGRLSLDMQAVDIAELAAASVESARPVAEGKGLELKLDVDGPIPSLWADPTRIAQLLDNLISNAVKFTPEGGSVTVVVETADDSCHLEVRDTGVGIPQDEVDKLFVRFYRASTSTVAAGTGLGLSIAKSIVEAHRGQIAVESELGAGTTFVVDIPLQASQNAVAVASTHKDQTP